MRYLLDTNLVEYAWRHHLGTENSTVANIAVPPHDKLAADLEALERLFLLAQRSGSPEFRVSAASLHELAQSPEADADAVLVWARELAAYAEPGDWRDDASSHRQAPLFSNFVRPGDAVLVSEAVRLGCDALLTCDYRLVRQQTRSRITRLAGVAVLTPSELSP